MTVLSAVEEPASQPAVRHVAGQGSSGGSEVDSGSGNGDDVVVVSVLSDEVGSGKAEVESTGSGVVVSELVGNGGNGDNGSAGAVVSVESGSVASGSVEPAGSAGTLTTSDVDDGDTDGRAPPLVVCGSGPVVVAVVAEGSPAGGRPCEVVAVAGTDVTT